MAKKNTLTPFLEFFRLEAASGILLLVCAALALAWANSPLHESYLAFWHGQVAGLSLHHWVDDGLMTIFFLVVGLEIKREFLHGELSSRRKAALPVAAAAGGMLVPALIYLGFNRGTAGAAGWGIPMATDIAFAIGVLVLLGKRVPPALKVFLTALAIIDDLGAVLIIAIFYTAKISWSPSVAGVLLALIIPSAMGNKVERALHPWVSFVIMPLFALANAGVSLSGGTLFHPVSLGVFTGLVFGKQIGITLFSWLAVQLRVAVLPARVSWVQIYGVGLLGGIGFTMSLFIANLAFADTPLIAAAKLGILAGSALSALAGGALLVSTSRN